VLIDGSEVFDPGDAQSWQNQGNWNRIAYFFEGNDFDATNGHSTPMPNNIYHHHVDPIVLHDFNASTHSPIIGYAFDGYPIYGPFGYANSNGSGGIKRMMPGYQLRVISDRQTLPDGTVSPGPSISGMYPLGSFKEDYEYVQGSGDLDEYNGRFSMTPEYPSGTYAYFAIIDDVLDPLYPYFIGPSYYGVADISNLGPNGGNNTIPGNAVQYLQSTTGISPTNNSLVQIAPNPAEDILNIYNETTAHLELSIYDMVGKSVINTSLPVSNTIVDISELLPGIYLAEVFNSRGFHQTIELVKAK